MVKLKGFQKLTLTDEALKKWLNTWQIKPKEETIPLKEALNRILAQNLIANEDLPRFDKSAVDGYAIKAQNSFGASQFKPIKLQLIENNEINDKQAKQVWTGQPIPKGADSVIMLENTKKRNNELEIWNQLAPGDNVSKKGEDIKKTETAAKAGKRLNPYHIGLAAALGITQLKVYAKPKIAIIATGNELAETGTERTENQIYESNKTMISTIIQEQGAESTDQGIAKDNIQEIAQKIKTALKTNDAIITTGGTSVGGLDLVPDAVNSLGKPGVVTHGIALRPGMPTALATLENKPVLILSGNPVAAIIGFEAFGRPMISRLLGMSQTEPRPIVKAILTKKISSALGRKTYVRVQVTSKNSELVATPVSAKGSGAITTMTQSNGFVIVPENREGISEQETVTVHLFANIEVKNENV